MIVLPAIHLPGAYPNREDGGTNMMNATCVVALMDVPLPGVIIHPALAASDNDGHSPEMKTKCDLHEADWNRPARLARAESDYRRLR
jgi:hypothetical protein